MHVEPLAAAEEIERCFVDRAERRRERHRRAVSDAGVREIDSLTASHIDIDACEATRRIDLEDESRPVLREEFRADALTLTDVREGDDLHILRAEEIHAR